MHVLSKLQRFTLQCFRLQCYTLKTGYQNAERICELHCTHLLDDIGLMCVASKHLDPHLLLRNMNHVQLISTGHRGLVLLLEGHKILDGVQRLKCTACGCWVEDGEAGVGEGQGGVLLVTSLDILTQLLWRGEEKKSQEEQRALEIG